MTAGSTKTRARAPSADPTNSVLDQFIQLLNRRKILWEFKLGLTQSQGMTVGATSVGVLLDGDTNPLNCRTLVGPIPALTKVAVIFVPPAGYYIVGIVGGNPLWPLGLVAGVTVLTTGGLNTASAAETDVPNLSFSATWSPLRAYEFRMQLPMNSTVGTDLVSILLRRDTALTGTQIGASNGGGQGTSPIIYAAWPLLPTTSETVSFFISHARLTGTGTFRAFGSPNGTIARTWAGLFDVGPASSMATS